MFPIPSLKTCEKYYTRLVNPLSCIYAASTSKTAYIRMCTKIQILLEFSLTWIWLTWFLAFHMPWDHSDLTFNYLFQKLYKELFDTLKAYERIESKETIVHCGWNLCLSLHPFVPWSTFVFSQAWILLVSLLSRDGGLRWWRPKWGIQFLQFADMPTEVVSIVISDFILIEISFPVQ